MQDQSIKSATSQTISLKWIPLLAVFLSLVACSGPQWSEYKNSEKGFTVLFPGKPRETSETQKQPYVELQTSSFMVEPKLGYSYIVYGVSVTNFKITAPSFMKFNWDNKTAYDNFQKSMLDYLQGKILSQQDMNISGLPGREFVVLTTKEAVGNTLLKQGDIRNRFSLQYKFMPDSLIVATRILRLENNIYFLILIHPEKKDISREKDMFFSSFKLDSAKTAAVEPPPAAPAPATTAAPGKPAAPQSPSAPAPAPAAKEVAAKKTDTPKAEAKIVKPDLKEHPQKAKRQPAAPSETMEQWKTFFRTADNAYEYDAKSVMMPAADIASVWIRTATKGTSNTSESLAEIHCSKNRYRFIQPQFQPWENIDRASFQESLYKTVCGKAVVEQRGVHRTED